MQSLESRIAATQALLTTQRPIEPFELAIAGRLEDEIPAPPWNFRWLLLLVVLSLAFWVLIALGASYLSKLNNWPAWLDRLVGL